MFILNGKGYIVFLGLLWGKFIFICKGLKIVYLGNRKENGLRMVGERSVWKYRGVNWGI